MPGCVVLRFDNVGIVCVIYNLPIYHHSYINCTLKVHGSDELIVTLRRRDEKENQEDMRKQLSVI